MSNDQHKSRTNSFDTDENLIPPATSTMICSNPTVCFRPTNGLKTTEVSYREYLFKNYSSMNVLLNNPRINKSILVKL